MAHYLIAVGTVLLVLVGWVVVQQIARLYARQHPQFGPYREEGGGCGSSCRCDSAAQDCPRKNPSI